jgi:hypothetical protein
MSIEPAIIRLLNDDSDVVELVGNRIFPIFVPKKRKLPAITYQQISGPRDNTFDGASGLANTRFQINCWARKYKDASELADEVRDALSPKDDSYPKTVEGIKVRAVMLFNENDVPSVRGDNEEMSGFGKMLDFNIWFDE